MIPASYLDDLPFEIAHIPVNRYKQIESLYDQIAYKNSHKDYSRDAVIGSLLELLEIFREYSQTSPSEKINTGYKYVMDAIKILQSDRSIPVE